MTVKREGSLETVFMRELTAPKSFFSVKQSITLHLSAAHRASADGTFKVGLRRRNIVYALHVRAQVSPLSKPK